MAQPQSGTDVGHDVTVSGEPARPDYGRDAAFKFAGNRDSLTADPAQVVGIFQSVFERADRYRQSFESDWMASYQQYHGYTEDPGKAEWQSQLHIPKSAQAVDIATGRVVSVIFGQEEWFSATSESRGRDAQIERSKRMLDWQFEKADARDPISQAVKHAMICGNGPLKVHVEQSVEPVTTTRWKKNPPLVFLDSEVENGGHWEFARADRVTRKMRLEPIIPTDFWLDPSGLNRFVIQRSKRTLSDIWSLAKDQKDESGEVVRPAVYDPDVVVNIRPGSRDQRLDNLAAIVRRERAWNLSEPMNDVYEFWGDLPDPATGITLYRNIFFTIVNKQWLVRKPTMNPFLHRKRPFIYIRAKLLPNQIYGYGLLGQTFKLQGELNRIAQLMIDRMHLSVPMVEVDEAVARNPEQFQGDHLKVMPGKMFKRKGGAAPDRPLFRPIQAVVPINEWEIRLFQVVTAAFDSVSGVNEFVSGAVETTQRKTKEEVQVRTSASQQTFNEAAQYIERTSLTPLVNMVWALMVQFEDDWDSPELLAQFADRPEDIEWFMRLKGMSPEERWMELRSETEFRVDGITRDIARQEELARYQQFMMMIQSDPLLSMLLDKREELREIMKLLNLRKGLVLSESDAILQAATQASLAQFAQMMGGAAPGSSGPGEVMAGQNPHNRATSIGRQAREAGEGSLPAGPQGVQ